MQALHYDGAFALIWCAPFQPACYIQQRAVNVEHFGVQLHSEI